MLVFCAVKLLNKKCNSGLIQVGINEDLKCVYKSLESIYIIWQNNDCTIIKVFIDTVFT